MFLDVLLSMRLSNLGQSVIDWDESPFIIVVSDLLRGHLPCVGLNDNKPPGIFLACGQGSCPCLANPCRSYAILEPSACWWLPWYGNGS